MPDTYTWEQVEASLNTSEKSSYIYLVSATLAGNHALALSVAQRINAFEYARHELHAACASRSMSLKELKAVSGPIMSGTSYSALPNVMPKVDPASLDPFPDPPTEIPTIWDRLITEE